MKAYLNADNSVDFYSLSEPIDNLPVGVYIPRYSDTRQIYLTRTTDFKYLDEYYLLDKFEEFVLESFKNSKRSIGALYLGLKGSGKTKRAHKLALDSGMPVLYIQDLNILNRAAWKDIVATNIFDNFVIFIDEYEKKLEEETTVALLEWLDGSNNNKQLFILIGNEKANNKYSNPLLDRLSRVLWRKTFGSLQEDEVRQLVEKLSIRSDKDEVTEIISSIPVLSLDNTLQIIKTTNLFKYTSVEDVVSMLNIEFNKYETFYLCDEKNNLISEYSSESLSISVKKSGIAFYKSNMSISLSDKFIEKLSQINPDVDSDCSVFAEINNEDIEVEFISKNKLAINVYYTYTPTTNDSITIKSKELIRLYLLKGSYYESLKFDARFTNFKIAL